MDNTEKLLRAFIKAQGYEIEEVVCTEQVDGVIDGMARFKGYDYINYKFTKKEVRTVKRNHEDGDYSYLCGREYCRCTQ